MSIRELLDDGGVAESWKKLNVASMRAALLTIIDEIISNNLTVQNDLRVNRDLRVDRDVRIERNLNVNNAGISTLTGNILAGAELQVAGRTILDNRTTITHNVNAQDALHITNTNPGGHALRVTGVTELDGTSNFTGLMTIADAHAANGIKFGPDLPIHALDYYVHYQSNNVTIVRGNAANVFYTKIGRQVTLTFVAANNTGLFTITAPGLAPNDVPHTPIQNFDKADNPIGTQLYHDLGFHNTNNAGSIFAFTGAEPAAGDLARVKILFNTNIAATFMEMLRFGGADMNTGDILGNFSFSFVAALPGSP